MCSGGNECRQSVGPIFLEYKLIGMPADIVLNRLVSSERYFI